MSESKAVILGCAGKSLSADEVASLSALDQGDAAGADSDAFGH